MITKNKIAEKLREILKVYHYETNDLHISNDAVIELENLLGSILRETPSHYKKNKLELGITNFILP